LPAEELLLLLKAAALAAAAAATLWSPGRAIGAAPLGPLRTPPKPELFECEGAPDESEEVGLVTTLTLLFNR